MSRNYDAQSDTSSRMPQPLTRASTTQDSDSVLTPTDITSGGSRYKGGCEGNALLSIRKEHSVGPSTPGSSYIHGLPDGLNSIREDGRYDTEPYGPYFSLPLDPTAHAAPLSRRTTTKELISRYESLDSDRSHYSRATSVSRASVQSIPPDAPAVSEKKPKGRSPIRQSFRNLLSVIGKKAKGLGRHHSTAVSSKASFSICLDSPVLGSNSINEKPSIAYLDIPRTEFWTEPLSSMPACNTPTALHAGLLLYLCKPVSPAHLPVWTDCSAVLHPSHVLVTWLTAQENPSTSMITFAQCTDVRSLAFSDLDPDERCLLPTQPDTGELKVFELLFEGRAREKFAAYSVTDRASWVSAIWDAVLLAQERKSYISSPGTDFPSLRDCSSNPSGDAQSHHADSIFARDIHASAAAPSILSSGYAADESLVGRSTYASSVSHSEPRSNTTSWQGTSLHSSTASQATASLFSSRGPSSSNGSRTGAATSVISSSPDPSIGFECRTDTSELESPRISVISRSRIEASLSAKSPTPSRVSSRLESALPSLPTPPLPSLQRFTLCDPPVPRSAAGTPVKTSFLQTPSPPRSQSPSIRNLSHCSVVKQRLAEIERSNTLTSQTNSTPRSTRSRQYSPLSQSPLSQTPTRKGYGGTSLRVNTLAASEEELIIDSYAESRGGSPLSVFARGSDRLTSVASRQSSLRSDLTAKPSARESSMRDGALNIPGDGDDIFSPTSEYSTDLLSPLSTPQRVPFGSISEVMEVKQKSPSLRYEDVPNQVPPTNNLSRLTRIKETPPPTQRTPLLRYEDIPTKVLPTDNLLRLTRIKETPSSAQKTPPLPFENIPPKALTPEPKLARLNRIHDALETSQKTPPLRYEGLPSEPVPGPLIFQSNRMGGINTAAPQPSLLPIEYAQSQRAIYSEPSEPRSVRHSSAYSQKTPVVSEQEVPSMAVMPPEPSPRPRPAAKRAPVTMYTQRPTSHHGYTSPVSAVPEPESEPAIRGPSPTESSPIVPEDSVSNIYVPPNEPPASPYPKAPRGAPNTVMRYENANRPICSPEQPSSHYARTPQHARRPAVHYDHIPNGSVATSEFLTSPYSNTSQDERSPVVRYENIPNRSVPAFEPPPVPTKIPKIPAGAQKTPLMLALESPRVYAPTRAPRGPPRPARLTKPTLLAAETHTVQLQCDYAPPRNNFAPPHNDLTPTCHDIPPPQHRFTPPRDEFVPPPVTHPAPPATTSADFPTPTAAPPSVPIRMTPMAQKDLPTKPAAEVQKSSRTSGLFAALRRPRRRSNVANEAPIMEQYAPSPAHQPAPVATSLNDPPPVRNEPPPVQVVREVIIERVPAPPVIQVDEETKEMMQNVEGAVTHMIDQESWNGEQLTGIRTQVDTVLHEIRQMPRLSPRVIQAPPPMNMPPPIDVSQITDRLDEMGTTLTANIPELMQRVEELMKQAVAVQRARSVVVMRNVPSVPNQVSSEVKEMKEISELPQSETGEAVQVGTVDEAKEVNEGQELDEAKAGDEVTAEPQVEVESTDEADAVSEAKEISNVESGDGEPMKLELFDPTQLEAKLDALFALCQKLQSEPQAQICESQGDGGTQGQTNVGEPNVGGELGAGGVPRNSELQEVLDLLKNDLDQRAVQSEQQADSVRYLNELNSWLEAFVNHGTSQIDGVLVGVQQLCKELGTSPELQVMQDISSNRDGDAQSRGPRSNLLSDVRRLLITSQEREGTTMALEASVNGLLAAVQEDLRRNAEARNALTMESIVGLIERQRQDQERQLRNLASDLSNDIRGERLRFVEAMKEATAINVQIHVEEFKKELTREVLIMTQEVGHLQKERQNLEQQIADLFSFYAKQKQAGDQSQERRIGPQRLSAPPRVQQPRPLPSMRRRPLPTPSPRPTSAMG